MAINPSAEETNKITIGGISLAKMNYFCTPFESPEYGSDLLLETKIKQGALSHHNVILLRNNVKFLIV